MSRIVDGRFVIGDKEKTFLCDMLWALQEFTGVQVITYCLMSNHVHLLLCVPDAADLGADPSDEELADLVRPLYGKAAAEQLAAELRNCDENGFDAKKAQIRQGYLKRRGRLDSFMKDLKQRFTQWYNREEGRRGTIWEQRYKSVLVGDSDDAILAMAAYIDLNPVRAGMVTDPADYPFSGYGEAAAGRQRARRGLAIALERPQSRPDWPQVHEEYRKLLYGIGAQGGLEEGGDPTQFGFDEEEALKELAGGGRLPLWKALRCRVRYFTDGSVFGSSQFVDSTFEVNRDQFGKNRQTGARSMRGGQWGDLRVLRDLQKDVYGNEKAKQKQ